MIRQAHMTLHLLHIELFSIACLFLSALQSTKQALEQELAELRKPAVPAFELNNGDELEVRGEEGW